MASFDSLMKEAGEKKYQIIWNAKSGRPRVIPPKDKKAADPEFERRLAANKAILVSGLSAPSHLKTRIKDASSESWLSQVNSHINSFRDRYAVPAAGAVGSFLMQDPTQIGQDVAGQRLGKSIGEGAVKTALPDSVTGKAIGLSMLAQPESFLARMAIPAGAGAVAGQLSGEGAGQGLGQGATAAAAGELPSIITGGKQAYNYMRRGELTKGRYDDVVPGDKLSSILNLKSFDRLRSKGENWVRALKDMHTGREATKRFGGNWESIMLAIKEEALAKGRAIQKTFMDDMKVPFNPRQGGYSENLWTKYHKMRSEAAEKVAEGRQLINAMRRVRGKGRAVFDATGRLKPGEKAYEEAQALNTLKDQIRTKLQSSFPKQAEAYSANDDEYALYKSLRDLMDKTNPITEDGRHVDLDKIMRELDKNPRPMQSRMKEQWDGIKDVMRRGAPTSEGFDQPGLASRIRAHAYGTHGRISSSLSEAGQLVGGAPLVTRPVGKVPGLLPKQPPITPGRVPRLVLGGTANEAVDEEKPVAP